MTDHMTDKQRAGMEMISDDRDRMRLFILFKPLIEERRLAEEKCTGLPLLPTRLEQLGKIERWVESQNAFIADIIRIQMAAEAIFASFKPEFPPVPLISSYGERTV